MYSNNRGMDSTYGASCVSILCGMSGSFSLKTLHCLDITIGILFSNLENDSTRIVMYCKFPI